MASERNRDEERRKALKRAAARKVVEEIVKEAEIYPQSKESESAEEIEKRFQESEKKRLLLAEALHSSRVELQKMMPGGTGRDSDKALPFGVFVDSGPEEDTVIMKWRGQLHEAKVLAPPPEAEPKPGKGLLHEIRKTGKRKPPRVRDFKRGELLLLNNDLQVLE